MFMLKVQKATICIICILRTCDSFTEALEGMAGLLRRAVPHIRYLPSLCSTTCTTQLWPAAAGASCLGRSQTWHRHSLPRILTLAGGFSGSAVLPSGICFAHSASSPAGQCGKLYVECNPQSDSDIRQLGACPSPQWIALSLMRP
jgi:hypothetical protein